MHVLSTPPAFILSQDQTLMFNVDPSSRSTSFFILVNYCSYKERSLIFTKIIWKIHQNFQGCLIVQLSKIFLWSAPCVQESLLFYHSSFCLSRTFLTYFVILSCSALQQLLYNIISDLICQELFNFSFRSDLYCSDRSPSATFIDYHIWQLMSRSFFILFRVKNGIWCYIFPPLFQRRWLSYHSCIQYVNYFFHLLETNFIS